MGEEPKAEPPVVEFMAPIIETLSRDDDLVAVLRGQLHIEALLSKVLASKYSESSTDLLDYVGYSTRYGWPAERILSQANCGAHFKP